MLVHKCDDCGALAQPGDWWIQLRLSQVNIRMAPQYSPEPTVADGEIQVSHIACSPSCALQLLRRNFQDIASFAAGMLGGLDEELLSVGKEEAV